MGIQPLVFDGGFVDPQRPTESEVNNNATQSQTQNGSSAGQRQRRKPRPRPPGEAKSFGSGAIEKTYGTGFRILVQHYEAISFDDRNGLWVAVKAQPLGSGGPQAHFLIGLPLDQRVAPRAWAFSSLGIKAESYPLKHTNFLDASICAFTVQSNAWSYEDGLLALVDHYSLWALKSLHKRYLGWWPGPQVGEGSFYRRTEFKGREQCGCGSGKLYENCHQATDLLKDEKVAHLEFRRLFRCEYHQRSIPRGVAEAARTKWRHTPDLAQIFSLRPNLDEPMIPLVFE